MTIIGIDPDVYRIAWSVFVDGEFSWIWTIERRKGERLDRDYETRLAEFFMRARNEDARVFVEGIYLGRNAKAFGSQAEVQGEIKFQARRFNVPLTIVHPKTWQKEVLNAKARDKRDKLKNDALALAETVPGIDPEISQHEADATCIALYGVTVTAEMEAAHGP